jgi:hypothetical protein
MVDGKLLEINASSVIERYEWYQNGVKKEGEGQYLFFEGINQEQDNGIYKCSIILKNGQIIESESFNLTVYKCNYQLRASLLFNPLSSINTSKYKYNKYSTNQFKLN